MPFSASCSVARCLSGLNLVFQVPYQPNFPEWGGLELTLGHGGTLMPAKPFPLTPIILHMCPTLICYPIACARASVLTATPCGRTRIVTTRLCVAMVPYSEISCQAARKLSAGNAHAFAIMSGGYVSQASLQNRTGLPITCPCGQISTMEHEIWECPYVPEILNRPRTPSNPIQMRLGWPIGNTNDEAVLAWMIACRKRSLALRYKPPR